MVQSRKCIVHPESWEITKTLFSCGICSSVHNHHKGKSCVDTMFQGSGSSACHVRALVQAHLVVTVLQFLLVTLLTKIYLSNGTRPELIFCSDTCSQQKLAKDSHFICDFLK